MTHYFENDPSLKSVKKDLTLVKDSEKYVFTTDIGVFSNKSFDYGSTLLLKEVMKHYKEGGILDLGAGYGYIGIILARTYTHAHVTMVDINERAIELTEINIAQNNVKNATALVSDGYQALANKKFSYIVINPPIKAGKKVYYPFFKEAKNYLTKDGTLMFVMKKKHGAKSAAKYVLEQFGNCTLLKKDAGYYLYAAISN